jgi:NADH:ubiquinone oxidoreductase subunit E
VEDFSDFDGKETELIPVLQNVQKEFGYLLEAAMREVARLVGVPESQVYAVRAIRVRAVHVVEPDLA